MTKVSSDDFDEWLDNPITLEVLQLIKNEAIAHRESAAMGIPLNAGGFDKIGEKYFSIINTAQVYENLLDNLTYENIFVEEENVDEI